ncbi:MAG: curli assembly protein CsgF [Flavobacteriaceae bacterium]|nr:curli assembly protein CsgF [Flavobacteriaceae bacterium]
MKYLLFIFLLSGTAQVFSQQLVYTPKNPAFGGDSFNYTWLLNSANAQNGFTDPDNDDFGDQTELERFAEDLNSSILGQVSRSLFLSEFGDEGLQPGTFTFGSLAIDIFETGQGLVIDILDTNTGEQTQVIIPN